MIKQVWQIASGDTGRDYSQLFLDYDVMLIGPGDLGKFEETDYRSHLANKKIDKGQFDQIKRFCQQAQQGHHVLLRSGYYVKAIGVIADAKPDWHNGFDDVYGWDLQHMRRVIWQTDLEDELKDLQTSGDLFAGRKQIPTFTGVDDPQIRKPIDPLLERCSTRDLKELPPRNPEDMSLETLGQELFLRGLPYDAIDKVKLAIQRQRQMAGWYAKHGPDSGRPTEHEIVAHLILPLLLSLGWSEQLLAVEWNRVDLAGFSGTPTTTDKCVLVCEAKGLGQGLNHAFGQAQGYVSRLKLKNCNKAITTDGLCVYLYDRVGDAWGELPTGYINFRKLRKNHIVAPGTNAADTLVALTPSGLNVVGEMGEQNGLYRN